MTCHFKIADFKLCIIFTEGQPNSLKLIPSFLPFIYANEGNKSSSRKKGRDEMPKGLNNNNEQLFSLTVDDNLQIVPKEKRKRIRAFETGNGDIVVDRIDDGGYQFVVKDIKQRECALIIADKMFIHCKCALNGDEAMRTFGINNALMLCFAYAASNHNTLLMHASLVRHQNKAYAFIAKSGTGKSTHVALWMRHIPECDIMNDDNPIVRIHDNGVTVYGGPWSGKTPCYRNTHAPLSAVVRIDRAKENNIEKLNPVEAFISVLPSCASMKWDEDIWDRICNCVTKLVEQLPCYILHCLPNENAARICHDNIHI